MTFAMLSVLLFVTAASVGQARAEATHAKCTCDLDGPARDSGAEVRNAAACFTSDFPSRNWCEIDVEALLGSTAHAELASGILRDAGQSEASAALMLDLFGSFVFETDVAERFGAANEDIWSVVQSAFGQNAETLGVCTDLYSRASAGELSDRMTLEADGLVCAVSRGTGWMHVRVALVDFGGNLSFRVAPPAQR